MQKPEVTPAPPASTGEGDSKWVRDRNARGKAVTLRDGNIGVKFHDPGRDDAFLDKTAKAGPTKGKIKQAFIKLKNSRA